MNKLFINSQFSYYNPNKTDYWIYIQFSTVILVILKKNVPQNFSQGDKLSPSDQILAQTLG